MMIEEIRNLMSVLEEFQISSECASAGGDKAEIQARYSQRIAFHSALYDRGTSSTELARMTEFDGQPVLGRVPLSQAEIDRLREKLAGAPIHFSPAEPPEIVVHLTNAFTRLWPGVKGHLPGARFVLATDSRYRPHASVQELVKNAYLILMGRYLIADLGVLAQVLARYVNATATELGAEPWRKEEFATAFASAMERCELRHEFAYQLCGIAEGERYRFGVRKNNDPATQQVAAEITAGALDFLLGHELAHIIEGHVSGPLDLPDSYPAWLLPACGILVETAGAKAEELVAAYKAQCLPFHKREFIADNLGLLIAAGDGPGGAKDLRLFGAQLAICVISFLDRARYLLESKWDPAALVGMQAYNFLGLIDLLMPQPSHPWGKTRASCLNNALFVMYDEDFPRVELDRKARIMQAVQLTFAQYVPYALGVMEFIESRPGEYAAFIGENDELTTCHFPNVANGDYTGEPLVTRASDYYGSASKIIWKQ